ncbi:hypothetical protein GF420_10905 [candidate division GN15 bacterium]|nr:hypothetical protein [candidate division GN15 bacterium]
MLHDITTINHLRVEDSEGEAGSVADLLIDDGSWTVRYVVIDIGSWLTGRKILVPPVVVGKPDWSRSFLPMSVSRERIEQSPEIDLDQPVSRQQEERLHAHFAWQPYWAGEPSRGEFQTEMPLAEDTGDDHQDESVPMGDPAGDPDLRSYQEMVGYRVQANDGPVGGVSGIIMDDETWTIRYVIVDADEIAPGRKLLLAVDWIDRVSWDQASLYVDMRQETIKESPAYDPSVPVNEPYEEALHAYYQQGGPKR